MLKLTIWNAVRSKLSWTHYRRYSASHRQRERGKNDEHNAIMKHLIARNTEAAVDLLRRHILATQTSVTQALSAIARA